MSARRFGWYTDDEHRAFLATGDRSIDSHADRITAQRRVEPQGPLTPMAEWWAKHGHQQRQPPVPKRRSAR